MKKGCKSTRLISWGLSDESRIESRISKDRACMAPLVLPKIKENMK